MFYSKTTNAFYDKDINGDGIPTDAVEITVQRHQELLQGQTEGKRITSDERGFPTLAEPLAPTPEEIVRQNNNKFRAYLAQTDWYVTRKTETGAEIPADVSEKRAAARAGIVG